MKHTEYQAIFNEVDKDDYYEIRNLPFNPNVVFDLGANVGVFTTLARNLIPRASIIAVEPDARNFALLKRQTGHLHNITYVNKALGTGDIWQGLPKLEPPYYGAIRSYVTQDQLGFLTEDMPQPPGQQGRDDYPIYEPSKVEAVSLAQLFTTYTKPDDLVLLKMDCEGGENSIFADPDSMEALHRVDCITMETHYYTKGTGTQHEANLAKVEEALMSLSSTHNCHLDREKRYFRATRKDIYA